MFVRIVHKYFGLKSGSRTEEPQCKHLTQIHSNEGLVDFMVLNVVGTLRYTADILPVFTTCVMLAPLGAFSSTPDFDTVFTTDHWSTRSSQW